MATYPTAIFTWTDPLPTDHTNVAATLSTRLVQLKAEVAAIETELGTTPRIDSNAVDWGSVKARLTGIDGAWTSYTPALTASTTNPTLGASSVTFGRYRQIGKLVVAEGGFKWGTGGTGGSGTYSISTPVAMSIAGVTAGLSVDFRGRVLLNRAGSVAAGDSVGGDMYQTTASVLGIEVDGWAAVTLPYLSATNPWSWGTQNDQINFFLIGEAS
jgi:hypothetical protein